MQNIQKKYDEIKKQHNKINKKSIERKEKRDKTKTLISLNKIKLLSIWQDIRTNPQMIVDCAVKNKIDIHLVLECIHSEYSKKGTSKKGASKKGTRVSIEDFLKNMTFGTKKSLTIDFESISKDREKTKKILESITKHVNCIQEILRLMESNKKFITLVKEYEAPLLARKSLLVQCNKYVALLSDNQEFMRKHSNKKSLDALSKDLKSLLECEKDKQEMLRSLMIKYEKPLLENDNVQKEGAAIERLESLKDELQKESKEYKSKMRSLVETHNEYEKQLSENESLLEEYEKKGRDMFMLLHKDREIPQEFMKFIVEGMLYDNVMKNPDIIIAYAIFSKKSINDILQDIETLITIKSYFSPIDKQIAEAVHKLPCKGNDSVICQLHNLLFSDEMKQCKFFPIVILNFDEIIKSIEGKIDKGQIAAFLNQIKDISDLDEFLNKCCVDTTSLTSSDIEQTVVTLVAASGVQQAAAMC